jgi:hypothetical protein
MFCKHSCPRPALGDVVRTFVKRAASRLRQWLHIHGGGDPIEASTRTIGTSPCAFSTPLATLSVGLLAAAFAGNAAAHLTANPNEAPADSYFRTALRVPHGCKGSPTVAVRVKLPEGVTSSNHR